MPPVCRLRRAAYIPKSVSPKTSIVNLEVYNPIAKTNNCLIYSIIVFLAMCLLLAAVSWVGVDIVLFLPFGGLYCFLVGMRLEMGFNM